MMKQWIMGRASGLVCKECTREIEFRAWFWSYFGAVPFPPLDLTDGPYCGPCKLKKMVEREPEKAEK
jgi:hypothetical protein